MWVNQTCLEPLPMLCLHSQWRQVLSMRDAVFMVSPAGVNIAKPLHTTVMGS